ncbi:unnamed protein product [Urochloa decumbens]|uniref:AAA+ ATPase domain-containing protein n=1 Tax=Urochloa decumbens TaxID=240449 RepID=A0ABC9AS71_9POAL
MEPAAFTEEQGVPSMVENAEVEIEEVLRLLEVLRAKNSELMEAVGPHRPKGDVERRGMAFMEMELSVIVGFLMTLSSQNIDGDMRSWLQQLYGLSSRIINGILEAGRRRHRLRLRVAQSFVCSSDSDWLSDVMLKFYRLSEHPCRYTHLLASSDPGLPAQAPMVGGLPLVGIDGPIKKLLKWLVPWEETDSSLRVLAVIGPVGIGKTTLAMELHNRIRLQAGGGHHPFQCSIIAQMSRRTNRNELLLQDILSQISDPAGPAPSSYQSQPKIIDLLVHQVSERLQDKRYLIIIDDIWEASDWETIKGAFPDNNHNSRILITTRVQSIEWSCCSGFQMKPLNQMDSETLLLAKTFGSVDDGYLTDDEKLFCENILLRCEGIPLFIIGMADWLKEQFQQQQHLRQFQGQEEVEEQNKFAFAIHSEEGDVPRLPKHFEQALSTIFDDLPSKVRPLLMCMSMFPYGYKFEKGRLFRKWLSEGFADWEEAEYYFSQLVHGNVITACVADNSTRSPDGTEDCQWHVNHFMQQFLTSKSADMGFVFTSTTLNLAAASATCHDKETRTMPRKLALHHPDPSIPSLLETVDLSETRSLSLSGAVSRIPLDKFVNLVVLDLEGWENLQDEDILLVCRSKLFFLEYLSIRNTRVRKLPREIKELRLVATLDVSYTQIKTAVMVPHDIRCLHNMHTLATIDLSEYPASFIYALGDLEYLLVLAITWCFHQCTDGSYSEALLSSIPKWKCLKSLTIHCGLGCYMEFLESLSDISPHLERFKVTIGRFAGLPKWIHGLRFLSFLQITICELGIDDLRILRDLPKLQCLILGAMPKLIYLQLNFCACPTRHIRVPLGITNLRRLRAVTLCYNLRYTNSPSIKMTVDSVIKEVAEHGNQIDLFINDIKHDHVQAVDEETDNATGTPCGTNAGAGYEAQIVADGATGVIEVEITEAES